MKNKYYIVLFILCACLLNATDETITIMNFKMQEFGDDDRILWKLNGKTATLIGEFADITRAVMILERGSDPLTIKSEKCLFNQETKIGKSSKPVHIEGKTISADGIGFDLDLNKQHIYIRSHVRVKLKKMKEKQNEKNN
ncbi:MAG: LPS export ABC transporter periplasmic protein LptC [Verrucomicrobiota bacterium]|nr:LPS export ABC transporter periplasmic protein LptC [Verrucomicrobiota bacterium]